MEKNIIVDGQKKKGDLVSADGVGSTVADEITFQIDTQLPSYQVGENGTVYKNPRFEISDKLQDVFENISEIKIQNAAGADLVANTDYELVNGVGSKDFTVKFKSEYLMAHGNEAVKIVYKTKLTSTETNQNFVSIPFEMLKSMIESKSNEYGITVIRQEESYTSKASFLDLDFIPTYNKKDPDTKYHFSGRRIHRGLYKSADGTLMNADINGAANILRKAGYDVSNIKIARLLDPATVRFKTLNCK